MEPNIDQFVSQFFTIPTLAFSVGVAIIVYFIRKILEVAFKNVKNATWWTDIVLPALPIAIAVLIASFAKKYPFPTLFSSSLSGRLFFGLICGAFADLCYIKVKKVISVVLDANSQTAQPAQNPPTAQNPPPAA